jgi:hypothetical protein
MIWQLLGTNYKERKKILVISQFYYGATNWMYVVLSSVTTLSGPFLLHPLKMNFNPKPPKILQIE